MLLLFTPAYWLDLLGPGTYGLCNAGHRRSSGCLATADKVDASALRGFASDQFSANLVTGKMNSRQKLSTNQSVAADNIAIQDACLSQQQILTYLDKSKQGWWVMWVT